jgi:iron complex outermembrane receptor protein
VIYVGSHGGLRRQRRRHAQRRVRARASGPPVPSAGQRRSGKSTTRAGFQSTARTCPMSPSSTQTTARVIAEDDFNDATFYSGSGWRVPTSINADWDLQLSHMRQQLDSDGVFFSDPELGDYDIQPWFQNDEHRRSNSRTLPGHSKAASAHSKCSTPALSRIARLTSSSTTPTTCSSGSTFPITSVTASVTYPGKRHAPSGHLPAARSARKQSLTETRKSMTHEIRFNTPEENRLRATVGEPSTAT